MTSLLTTPKEHLDDWEATHRAFSFEDYLGMVKENPKLLSSAYEYLYDMIMSYGTESVTKMAEAYTKYLFFSHSSFEEDAIYGLDKYLEPFMRYVRAAAERLGPERRVFLLVGPVGSSKSSIVRIMKRGLEKYSAGDPGALYSYSWRRVKGDGFECSPCPLNEQPLKLIPSASIRSAVLSGLGLTNSVIEGDLCPFCQESWDDTLKEYQGDWARMLKERIIVRRVVFNENRRIGLGSFQPKDPKDQDPTELLGDINYRKIAEMGIDSSPFAFNFDGEFEISNRGLLEIIEILKLDCSFLYEFLGAAQERRIKPKKFTQVGIDEVLLGHSNLPELNKLLANEYMEAFRDRTIRVDIPYLVNWSDEVKIYQKSFAKGDKLKKHIAPHTIEMAALWAILTRLEKPKADISLIQKAKLYDGQSLTGWTDQTVRDMRNESTKEGFDGISPRYIQDKISNAMVNTKSLGENEVPDLRYPHGCINPFSVLTELENGLPFNTLVTSTEKRIEYMKLLSDVKTEYEEKVKDDVRRAISADEDALARLCSNYLENIKAYTAKEKVINKFTGKEQDPDERLMRSVEERIDIPENRKEDFRREVMNYVGARAMEGKTFTWNSNERLKKALEMKLFEEQKDTLKLVSAGVLSANADKDQLEKIDLVKGRLIDKFGMCSICSQDVLVFVSSIFARG